MLAIAVPLLALGLFVLSLPFIPPSASKRGPVPAVPFWTSFYDVCRGVSRLQFYKTRLQPLLDKYGAVYVWNAGRWTVMVTKPEYLLRMFRNEDIVAKGGFYRKIPWGSFAMLFGENIIDSHGPLWVRFASIIKPGIQKPTDICSLRKKSANLAELLLQAQEGGRPGRGVAIDRLLQRWAVAVYGVAFLDTEIGCLEDGDNELEKCIAATKRNIVGPFFAEFPALERFSFLFPSRRRALAAIKRFETLLVGVVDAWSRKKTNHGPPSPQEREKVVHRLVRAHEQGELSDFHFRSNLKMLTIAGHENLINRVTLADFTLAPDITIPRGTWMGWNSYGVHTNPEFWGESATDFDPLRWGRDISAVNSLFRLAQARGYFIPFNAYMRRCPGSGFALAQMKVCLVEMLRRASWTRDPDYHFSTTARSVLAPKNCRLVFARRG
ncbi:cytochrome P450 [Aspergillus egyptiacus]|nr:cytochrome P450 [Aspergillus egyptiacus]